MRYYRKHARVWNIMGTNMVAVCVSVGCALPLAGPSSRRVFINGVRARRLNGISKNNICVSGHFARIWERPGSPIVGRAAAALRRLPAPGSSGVIVLAWAAAPIHYKDKLRPLIGRHNYMLCHKYSNVLILNRGLNLMHSASLEELL
jgi:hypothetical protein